MRFGGKTKLAVTVLLGICVVVVGLQCWDIYGIGGYRSEICGLSGVLASEQALADFRHGRLRLMRLGGEQKELTYSGEHEGPFEIWYPQYYPSLGAGHRYSTRMYVEFYNRKTQYMHEHPEKFRSEPQVDANQPVNKR